MLMAFRFYSSGDGTEGVAEMLTSRRAQRGGGLTSEGVSLSVLTSCLQGSVLTS